MGARCGGKEKWGRRVAGSSAAQPNGELRASRPPQRAKRRRPVGKPGRPAGVAAYECLCSELQILMKEGPLRDAPPTCGSGVNRARRQSGACSGAHSRGGAGS